MANINFIFPGKQVRALFEQGQIGYVVAEVTLTDASVTAVCLKSYIATSNVAGQDTQIEPGEFSDGCPTPPCVASGNISILRLACIETLLTDLGLENKDQLF